MSLELTKEQEAFIEQKLATGEYTSVSELLTEAFEALARETERSDIKSFRQDRVVTQELDSMVRDVKEQNKNKDPDELQRKIDEAVDAVRYR